MSSRRTFTTEYKRECAELVIQHGYQAKEAAKAMKAIHPQVGATYGTRRMQIKLNEMGYKIGRFKVRRMMKQHNLLAKRPKQHRYPIGGRPSVIAANSLNRQFNPEQPNTHWGVILRIFEQDKAGCI